MGNKGLRSLSKSQEWYLIVEELVLFLFGAPEIPTIPRNGLRNVQRKISNLNSYSSINLEFEFILQISFVSGKIMILVKWHFKKIEKINKKNIF